jgi:lipopolysaccharide export LptBFGC system permease protein LptF
MKTWEKYVFIKFSKLFLSFLFLFFILYVLIDYSLKVKSFSQSEHSIFTIVMHYIFHFSKRLSVLFPLTLMLASIRLLTQSNRNNELLALVTGGIPLWKVVRPMVTISCIVMAISYCNTQFFLPKALAYLEYNTEPNATFLSTISSTHALPTKKGGTIVYQKYFPKKQEMFDVWWLKSSKELIRIKYLYPFELPPKGLFTDHLERSENEILEKTHSFSEEMFPSLEFDVDSLEIQSRPPEVLSLSELLSFALKASITLQPVLWSWFWLKALLPIICLFAVLFPVRYCTRFERSLNLFLIYSISLFLLLTLFTLMDTALIIGEHGILPSYLIISLPMIVYLLFFSWRLFTKFVKIK